MTDIVERLRSHTPPKIKDLDEAADEIERLRCAMRTSAGDIPKRLRGIRICENFPLVEQAASEIERLRGRVAEAEGREQLLLRRCDELEGDRNESDGEVERLRSLIAEARDYIIKNAPIEDKTVGDLVNRLCSALR